MSDFLQAYLDYGLSDIVELESTFCEPSEFYKEEGELVAARKGNKYVVARLTSCVIRFMSSRSKVTITHEPITQTQYEEYASGKTIIDTPEARHKLAEDNKRIKRREKLGKKLRDCAPLCPDCRGKTTVRKGKYGPLWGCCRYPTCGGWITFSGTTKALYKKWLKTFDSA
jgi:hypothetical protein